MQDKFTYSRRTSVKSSMPGLLSVSFPKIVFAKQIIETTPDHLYNDKLFHRHPSFDDEIVASVVGVSHTN